MDKIRKCFLWADSTELTGGKCKVNWTKSCMPKELGGLGVLNLEKFARALRLRWLWHDWVSPNKPWVSMELPCDETDRLVFAACTTIRIGNGRKASFWKSSWVQGRRPKDIAPLLYVKSEKKNRVVADALHDNNWIRDLDHKTGFTVQHFIQFATQWNLIRNVHLLDNQDDSITWKLTASGVYTAASAYRAQFLGCTKAPRICSI